MKKLFLAFVVVLTLTYLANNTRPFTGLTFDEFRTRVAIPERREPAPPASRLNSTASPVSGEPLVIANGTIIDGTGGAPISQGTVVIRGNRIVRVGEASAVIIPANAIVIDVSGKTVMPGIINSHVHFGFDPQVRHNFLVDGVTSVCDLGTSLRNMPNFERQFTIYDQPAARGFKAGPMITVPGGYPGTIPGFAWHYATATPQQSQAAVEDLLGQDVDVIKIALEPGPPGHPWPVLTQGQVRVIVVTAHTHGKLVRAHVRQATMLDRALEAGVDVIEHTPLPFCLETELKQIVQQDALHLGRQPAFKAQLARMARQEVILVPTLDPHTRAIANLRGLNPDEREAAFNFTMEIIGYYRSLGGQMALGNDYGNPGVRDHLPLREMELLLTAGLTPMEVIMAGTRHAAYVSGHGDELGTLEPGKLADLIVVNGDPLADIGALQQVVIVIKDGQIVQIANEQL